jgi:MFS family permease
MVGLSLTSFPVYTTGLYIAPLQHDFGWTRGNVTGGLMFIGLSSIPFSPFVGALIDRFGARRVAIPGVVLFAAGYSIFALATPSTALWLGLWAVFATLQQGINPAVWTAAVSGHFQASRGLALAATLCGIGFASVGGPIVVRWLIDAYGWRASYEVVGLGWGGLALVLVALFFFDAKDRARKTVAGAAKAAPAAQGGLTFTEALRNPTFLKLAGTEMLVVLLLVGLTVHLVPILTQLGVSRATAAGVASIGGVASLVAKLCTGWLLDRLPGERIAAFCVSLPVVPCLLLLFAHVTVPIAAVCAAAIGFSIGGQLQTLTYLITRHTGLRAYGKIYGVFMSLASMGAGFGPVIAGMVFDRFGDYRPLFMAGLPVAAICGLMMITLGPYPVWEKTAAADEDEAVA